MRVPPAPGFAPPLPCCAGRLPFKLASGELNTPRSIPPCRFFSVKKRISFKKLKRHEAAADQNNAHAAGEQESADDRVGHGERNRDRKGLRRVRRTYPRPPGADAQQKLHAKNRV